jgi:hypothetical protein
MFFKMQRSVSGTDDNTGRFVRSCSGNFRTFFNGRVIIEEKNGANKPNDANYKGKNTVNGLKT